MILGSTGSIGTQAIDLVLRNPDRFRVTALSAAGGRVALLAEQAHRLRRAHGRRRPRGRRTGRCARRCAARYGAGEPLPEILAGPDAATELAASDCHTVLNGITGSIGLAPTLAALEAGRTLALANKESLIVGGPLVKALAKPGQIIPVDSEHAALFQALAAGTRADVRKLVVTASGGPFRGRTRAELADVTREQALAHPTWAMGPVITINSATLVNKGLEVIEAHLLYDIPFDRIEVVVHPQSYVHSMVEFTDGSTLAQATPARHARAHRHRPRLARAGPGRGPRLRLDARRPPGSSSRSTPRPSRRSASPGMSVRSAAPPPRCSMRPTRSASTRSSPDGCRSTGSWIRSPRVVEEHGTPAHGNLPDRRGRPRSGDLGPRPGPGTAAATGDSGGARMTTSDDVLGIVVFVVGLLFSIAWHELGHLSTAKMFGIRVPQYMVGFGPTHLVAAEGRDRVRHQGHPARRLHPHDRHVPARRRRPARSPLHLPVARHDRGRPLGRVRGAEARRREPALLHAQAVEARHRDVRRARS